MSDYIKKQDVLDILYNTFEEYNMTTDKQDKHGGFGAEVFERVKDIPTLDEKEIIRKPMERILKRLKGIVVQRVAWFGKKDEICIGVDKAIEIVKEEGWIE